ncbi:EEF1A lysine methyltransferase 2 [Chionoecetes opilio]|uniref:EEF1A lysine methyltransferase 2 n=1 Tax=Chionoecetes opilio TaxID=41210 RepID=A0A8J5D1M5_CHIOP|nr:EEF1A lysine methyltransferase 2 [Chionoecetes opilio]
MDQLIECVLDSDQITAQSSIIDIGCGNGAFLLHLQVDILNPDDESLSVRGYDLCHDKSTYDAVSMCPDDPWGKRAIYIQAVHRITHKDGLFIITSVNWTQEELMAHFSDCKSLLIF